MHFCFTKYQGAGNDFIVVDDRNAGFPVERQKWIQHLCHRRMGIGADGLILLQSFSSIQSDYNMRIFNADGKEAAMCGNGVRCLVHFIRSLEGKEKERYRIQTQHGVVECQFQGDKIAITLANPKKIYWGLALDNEAVPVYVCHTGVPHAVLFFPHLDSQENFVDRARSLRFNPALSPEGANVNFAEMRPDGLIEVRTYERGVEEETYACGTGAAAVALVAKELFKLENPVRILPLSKDMIEVFINPGQLQIVGSATPVFHGEIKPGIS